MKKKIIKQIKRKHRPIIMQYAEIELELKDHPKGLEFTAMAIVYASTRKVNFIMGGQCFDSIQEEYEIDDETKLIIDLWRKHHLNTMHAGTPKQEKALEKANFGSGDYYRNACNFLEQKGLLVDDGYKYGSGWLYQPIPEEDLTLIKKLIGE